MKIMKLLIVIAFLLGSCRSARVDYTKSFQELIEYELKIKDFFKNNSYQTRQLEMTNGQIIRVNDGLNQVVLDNRDTTLFTATIKEGLIQSLSKTYSNYQGYNIIKKFNVKNNEIKVTTTNRSGDVIGIYVESYFTGHYSDITIDSLGQSFEEWGNTNRKYH